MASDEITTIEELREFLYLAMQIEYATVPVYLTALYSIKPGTNPDAAQILRVTAIEEMLHLTLAANILNAIGGKPDLTRTGFMPNFPAFLPDGETEFKVHLMRFSKQALDTFLKIERPSMAPEGKAKLILHTFAADISVLGVHPADTKLRFYSIGDFYQAIDDGIEALEKKAQDVGKTIFTGDPERQVTAEYFYSGGGKLFPVVDLDSARSAIRKIIEQGEGEVRDVCDTQGEIAHYFRFDQLAKGRYYLPGDKPGEPSGPTFSVDWNSSYPIAVDAKLKDFVSASELYDAAVTFNEAYASFLETITMAYNGDRAVLLKAVPKMFEFRNLMNQLIRNPLPGSQQHAAPTFEIDAAKPLEEGR